MNNKNDISGGDGSPYIHAPSNEQELDQDLVPITSTGFVPTSSLGVANLWTGTGSSALHRFAL